MIFPVVPHLGDAVDVKHSIPRLQVNVNGVPSCNSARMRPAVVVIMLMNEEKKRGNQSRLCRRNEFVNQSEQDDFLVG
jgi:hypothetical protein